MDLKKLQKNRTYIKDIFGKSGIVEFVGWVYNTRALGKINFLEQLVALE